MAESIKKFIIKDAHGGTKEQGSFSVVGEVHVYIEPGYGEPYADSEYVNGILTITIYNIEGKVMKQHILQPANDHIDINVSNMPAGIYIYRVGGATGKFLVQ